MTTASSETTTAEPELNGIWQISAQETEVSYAAFKLYMDLGPQGTHQQVSDSTGKSLEAIQKLSARHRWLERAAAWRQAIAASESKVAKSQAIQNRRLAASRQQILKQQEWE